MNKKTKVIAFYLPQFYPTPENDEWWGKGFTEWTNVGRAKPIYKGHVQPKVPTELGYYDLRVSETREAQASMAKEYGIDGFCYWHYWFGNGKRLLELPFKEVLESKKPDFPFCLCWANHSWYAKTWDPSKKKNDKLLIEQTYPGIEDYTKHFYEMLPAFKDSRYMKTNEKLIFGLFDPIAIPDPKVFMDLWNALAIKEGLSGFYFFGYTYFFDTRDKILELGYDASVIDYQYFGVRQDTTLKQYIKREFFNIPPKLYKYNSYVNFFIKDFEVKKQIHPCLLPNFDHSPRSGKFGLILKNSTPEKWGKLLQSILQKLKNSKSENNLVFIKSWNEWGEGNYLEPELQYGKQYLEMLKNQLHANS